MTLEHHTIKDSSEGTTKKMNSISLLFSVILMLKVIEGKLETTKFSDKILHSYATGLVKPLMHKTSEMNQTIQDYWTLYDKNMKKVNSRFKDLRGLSLNVSNTKNNTCQELQDVMTTAQDNVNNATVVLVEVLQKMALKINKYSCLSYNIFTTISCFAHKAQDVRGIYRDYKDQIVANDLAAAQALKEIVVEFIKCLKRLG